MFLGFNDYTLEYWERLRNANSKENFRDAQALYCEGIKKPLEELYCELRNYLEKVDSDFNFAKRSCIASPYNDMRFCSRAPMKEYVYIRFKLIKKRQNNVIGFFFDASESGFGYGINIYNLNARGMEQIRGEILRDEEKAEQIIGRVIENNILQVSGDMYKQQLYIGKEKNIQKWLNMKNICLKHYEPINNVFFSRELLDNTLNTFEQSKDLFFMLKHALR